MIVMQVRAHHQIDLVGPRAGRGEPVEPRRVEHVPRRPQRPGFLVAAAAVDQDLAAVELQQPAVHAELDLARGRIVVVGRQPVRVLGELRLGHRRENIRHRIDRQIGFLDAGDGGLADLED